MARDLLPTFRALHWVWDSQKFLKMIVVKRPLVVVLVLVYLRVTFLYMRCQRVVFCKRREKIERW